MPTRTARLVANSPCPFAEGMGAVPRDPNLSFANPSPRSVAAQKALNEIAKRAAERSKVAVPVDPQPKQAKESVFWPPAPAPPQLPASLAAPAPSEHVVTVPAPSAPRRGKAAVVRLRCFYYSTIFYYPIFEKN